MVMQFLALVVLWIAFLSAYLLFLRSSGLKQKMADSVWQEEVREVPWPNERRRYQRRYLPYPIDYADLEKASLREITLTHDISKGGTRFASSHPLSEGSRLFLSIELPEAKPLSLFGEVVWQSSRVVEPPRFDIGIRFVDLSSSNIMRIAHHL